MEQEGRDQGPAQEADDRVRRISPGRVHLGPRLAVAGTLPVICVSASPPLIAACAALLAGHRHVSMSAGVCPHVRLDAADLSAGQTAGRSQGALSRAGAWRTPGTWIPSLRLTTVALSTAMISTQPVWTALLARIAGAPCRCRGWGIDECGRCTAVDRFRRVGDRVVLDRDGLGAGGGIPRGGLPGFGERLREVHRTWGRTPPVVYGVAGLSAAGGAGRRGGPRWHTRPGLAC